MKILFKPSFVRQYNNLDEDLQNEILEKVELFKNRSNHGSLNVHKLHGKLSGTYSFYVNYKIRIVFVWEEDDAILLAVGDHDIYK